MKLRCYIDDKEKNRLTLNGVWNARIIDDGRGILYTYPLTDINHREEALDDLIGRYNERLVEFRHLQKLRKSKRIN